MMRAYPRHTVNLSAGCYAALLSALCRARVLDGPEVARFEQEFARFIGTRHAVGVSSGRAALSLALEALGVGAGDQVIMPAYSFHVVPLVMAAHGIEPVFADVRADTWNVDVTAIERLITPRTKAILATHIYGQPCDMDPLLAVARAHGVAVLEDCAHACGARYGARRVGSLGHVGLFTFAMAKNMPCFGGGMITTDDPQIHDRLLQSVQRPRRDRLPALAREVAATTMTDLATRGPVFSWVIHPLMLLAARAGRAAFDREPARESVSAAQVQASFRTRITALQAAVGIRQLARLDAGNARLAENAAFYSARLADGQHLSLPLSAPGRTSTGLYYRVRVTGRASLRRALLHAGVDTAPDDMSDCSALEPFRDRGAPVPVAAGLPSSVVELPNNVRLRPGDLSVIADAVLHAVRTAPASAPARGD